MASYRQANRKMFWRIVGHLLVANPSRLFVILLALGSGAAITAALLNLQIDAKRRLTTDFSAFGPNVLITPRTVGSASGATLDESIIKQVPLASSDMNHVGGAAYLYLIADASSTLARDRQRVVVAGVHALGADNLAISARTNLQSPDKQLCIIGHEVVAQMHLQVGDRLMLRGPENQEPCQIAFVTHSGDAEDTQVLPHLDVAQRLAGLPGRISLIQLTVRGTPKQIDRYISALQQKLPDAEVRPIRQFTEGEAKIYNRISGLLTATVLIILLLTFFCVMAAMTNVAMERRNDVGLMKALGGSVRRIVRLFFAEAALLGLAGGLIGSTIGILLSTWLGKAVFGLAARPRLIVYPIAIMLTFLVSLASALPLRRLASIRPASVFRDEA